MPRAVADERHILTAAGVAVPQLIYGTAWNIWTNDPERFGLNPNLWMPAV